MNNISLIYKINMLSHFDLFLTLILTIVPNITIIVHVVLEPTTKRRGHPSDSGKVKNYRKHLLKCACFFNAYTAYTSEVYALEKLTLIREQLR